jgi:hypothetical protein
LQSYIRPVLEAVRVWAMWKDILAGRIEFWPPFHTLEHRGQIDATVDTRASGAGRSRPAASTTESE